MKKQKREYSVIQKKKHIGNNYHGILSFPFFICYLRQVFVIFSIFLRSNSFIFITFTLISRHFFLFRCLVFALVCIVLYIFTVYSLFFSHSLFWKIIDITFSSLSSLFTFPSSLSFIITSLYLLH